MQRRSPLCKPRFLRVAKLLRFQSSTLGTGVVGGVAQGRAGCSDRAVSESELGGTSGKNERCARRACSTGPHGPQGLMGHARHARCHHKGRARRARRKLTGAVSPRTVLAPRRGAVSWERPRRAQQGTHSASTRCRWLARRRRRRRRRRSPCLTLYQPQRWARDQLWRWRQRLCPFPTQRLYGPRLPCCQRSAA